MVTGSAGPWLEDWLSPPRFAVYLRAAGDDRWLALQLYEWNAAVSAALLRDLAHLEVGLRNAYDRALSAAVPAGRPHWVFDPLRFFPPHRQRAANGTHYDANETIRRKIATAIRDATSPGPAKPASAARNGQPSPGKVVAELSFGFWRYLSVKRLDTSLWVPHLHKGFQLGVSRRAVDEPIGRVHALRNRVAHHEPLLRTDLHQRHHDLLTVAHLISHELGTYLASTSSCVSVINQRPC